MVDQARLALGHPGCFHGGVAAWLRQATIDQEVQAGTFGVTHMGSPKTRMGTALLYAGALRSMCFRTTDMCQVS